MATATSLTGQKPPATSGAAWWNPPRRLRARRPTLRGFGWKTISRAASMTAPQTRRTVFIISSTGTSLGSIPKICASVSARPSESSSSGVWTRASSSYPARRAWNPVRASSALSGHRYSGAYQTARSRP